MTILRYEDCLIESCRAQIRWLKETIQDEKIYAYALILTEGGTQAFGYYNTLERYQKDLEDDIAPRMDLYVTGHLWSAAGADFSPFDDWTDMFESVQERGEYPSDEQMAALDYDLEDADHSEIRKNVMLAIRDEVYAEPRGCFVEDVFISLQDFADDVNMTDSMTTSKLINSKAGHELTKRYWSGYVSFQEILENSPHLA